MKKLIYIIFSLFTCLSLTAQTNRRTDTIQFNNGGSDALKLYNGINTTPYTFGTGYLVLNGQFIAGSQDVTNNRRAIQGFSYSAAAAFFASKNLFGGDVYSENSYGLNATSLYSFGVNAYGGAGGLNAYTQTGTGVTGASTSGLAGEFVIDNASVSNIIQFRRGATIKAFFDKDGILSLNTRYKMPATAGTAGQVLTSAGNNNQFTWSNMPAFVTAVYTAYVDSSGSLYQNDGTWNYPPLFDPFTITSNGNYLITYSGICQSPFTGNNPMGRHLYGIMVNGTVNNSTLTRSYGTNAVFTRTVVISLTTNDIISLRVRKDVAPDYNSTDLYFKALSICIIKIN